jgi:hypothetical protein
MREFGEQEQKQKSCAATITRATLTEIGLVDLGPFHIDRVMIFLVRPSWPDSRSVGRVSIRELDVQYA